MKNCRLKQQTLLFIQETGSPRSRCQQGWCLARAFLLGCRRPPAGPCSHDLSLACVCKERVGGGTNSLVSLLTRTLILLAQVPTLPVWPHLTITPHPILSLCFGMSSPDLTLLICALLLPFGNTMLLSLLSHHPLPSPFSSVAKPPRSLERSQRKSHLTSLFYADVWMMGI